MKNTQKITPFLWFDGRAEEAMNFYTSVFKNAKVGDIMRQSPDGPVFSVTFNLEGQEFMALNGGPMYQFTPAISFFVSCKDQAEVDYYWDRLLEDGKPNRCGWLTDKFGLSWQVVPAMLGELLWANGDAAKAQRAMQAMLQMVKLDIEGLKNA